MKMVISALFFLFPAIFLNIYDRYLIVKDYPIHVIPSKFISEQPMVFFITGDGGYTSFDKSFCQKLAATGMPVVALDALKYFWNEKTPESATTDVQKIIGLYKTKWQKDKVVLIGYSFGADAVPFIYNKLSKSQQSPINSLVLMSPAATADFEIHISDMLSLGNTRKKYDVVAEIDKIQHLKILCIYGSEENDEVQEKARNPELTFLHITGGHHYNDNYEKLVEAIVAHSIR